MMRRVNWPGLIGTIIVLLFILGAVFAPVLSTSSPNQQNLHNVLASPSMEHPFGTDNLGRDSFSRMLYGGRTSLMIAFFASLGGMVIGVTLGVNGGFRGGLWDTFVMRGIDVLLAFPGFLLALTLIALLGFGLHNIILAIGVISIPAFARLSRSSALSVKSREYITAAYSIGATQERILWYHVLPNSLAPVITLWALQLGTSVIIASGLGFLGLGVQPPTPEWGAMLSEARNYMQLAPRLVVMPGVAVTLVVLGFALMGDWLRDLLDPKEY